MKRVFWEVIGLIFLIVVIHIFFSVEGIGLVILLLEGMAFLPIIHVQGRKRDQSALEFYELTSYMEQMICSYKRTGTLSEALADCTLLFHESGKMGQLLRRALYALKTGEGAEERMLEEYVLGIISEKYSSRRLKLLHDFIVKVQRVGGNLSDSFDIILRDIQMWKQRVLIHQEKIQYIQKTCSIAMVLAVSMCYLSQKIMPDNVMDYVKETRFYQGATTVTFFLLFLVQTFILCRNVRTWLDTEKEMDSKKEKIENKKYMLLKQKKSGIRHYYALEFCRERVEKEFPYWLLAVTVYLQMDSVYQAVYQSMLQVKGIFLAEIRQFLVKMYEEPASLLPYRDFFAELKLEEIQSGMRILYSAANNQKEDISRQIHFLVEQSNRVMDVCETQQLTEQRVEMELWRQVPMIIAGAKVVIDMILFLSSTMGRLEIL